MRILAASLLLSGLLWGDASSDVRALDQRWAEATVHADAAALGRILSDDLTYTHTDGHADTKATFIETVRSGKIQYQSIQFEDSNVRVYGDTAVAASRVRVKLKRNGQDVSLHPLFLHVYVKRHGVWQMVAHQATLLNEP